MTDLSEGEPLDAAQRGAKLLKLRTSLQAAIDEDVWFTWDEVVEYINRTLQDEVRRPPQKQSGRAEGHL